MISHTLGAPFLHLRRQHQEARIGQCYMRSIPIRNVERVFCIGYTQHMQHMSTTGDLYAKEMIPGDGRGGREESEQIPKGNAILNASVKADKQAPSRTNLGLL